MGQDVALERRNVDGFLPLEDFTEKVDNLIKTIKNSPTAEGVKEIMIPGEPEFKERAHRLKSCLLYTSPSPRDS